MYHRAVKPRILALESHAVARSSCFRSSIEHHLAVRTISATIGNGAEGPVGVIAGTATWREDWKRKFCTDVRQMDKYITFSADAGDCPHPNYCAYAKVDNDARIGMP